MERIDYIQIALISVLIGFVLSWCFKPMLQNIFTSIKNVLFKPQYLKFRGYITNKAYPFNEDKND